MVRIYLYRKQRPYDSIPLTRAAPNKQTCQSASYQAGHLEMGMVQVGTGIGVNARITVKHGQVSGLVFPPIVKKYQELSKCAYNNYVADEVQLVLLHTSL